MTETRRHYAARRSHVEQTVKPALAGGAWVVSDRFADSTMAYQGSAGSVGRAAVADTHRLVLADFGPDLTLILDLPVEQGLHRAQSRPAPAVAAAHARYQRLGPGDGSGERRAKGC